MASWRRLIRNGASTVQSGFRVDVSDPGYFVDSYATASAAFTWSFSFVADTGEITASVTGGGIGHKDAANAGIGYNISYTTNASYTQRQVILTVTYLASAGRTLANGVTAAGGDNVPISVEATASANLGIDVTFTESITLKLDVLENF